MDLIFPHLLIEEVLYLTQLLISGQQKVQSTRATIEMHHFFSEVPDLRSLTLLSQKLIWRKLKRLPEEKSHSLGVQRESCKPIPCVFPTILT